MPIKYPSKYQPKYYNPNWSQYSHKKISWDYHEQKKNGGIKKSIIKPESNDIKEKPNKYTIYNKFPPYK